jgi:hypothetical protein
MSISSNLNIIYCNREELTRHNWLVYKDNRLNNKSCHRRANNAKMTTWTWSVYTKNHGDIKICLLHTTPFDSANTYRPAPKIAR